MEWYHHHSAELKGYRFGENVKKNHFCITLLLVCFSISSNGRACPNQRVSTPFPAGDGALTLYSYHLDQVLKSTYRHNGCYDESALEKINSFFRSRSDNKIHSVDRNLIELLDHLQEHFQADQIELISGYRSPELNKSLKDKGAKVAEESLHMQGQAADIHIDEVTEEAIRDYLHLLKVGGVGYYPKWDFVHVDTGDVRKWDMPDTPGRLLIAFRKGTNWQVTPDKNIYLPKDPISIELLNIVRSSQSLPDHVILQLFRGGKWIEHEKMPLENHILKAGATFKIVWKPKESDPFGKFRIIIPMKEQPHYLYPLSNELYRKRM